MIRPATDDARAKPLEFAAFGDCVRFSLQLPSSACRREITEGLSLTEIEGSPFSRYRGYLSHLKGQDPDGPLEAMRGR